MPSYGDDTVWRAILRHAQAQSSQFKESHVKVGVIGKGSHGDEGITMVELAAIHEFGSPKAHIPERSFIRSTCERERERIGRITQGLAADFIAGKPLATALGQLGAFLAHEIKKTITEKLITPEEKPATKIAKNRRAGQPDDAETTPLVDTGRLVNAITWKVWLGPIRDARGRFVKGGGRVSY
jgi:hypothetical protein